MKVQDVTKKLIPSLMHLLSFRLFSRAFLTDQVKSKLGVCVRLVVVKSVRKVTGKILKIVGKIHLHTYLVKQTMISNAMFSRSLITSLRSVIILSNFASKHKSSNLSDPEFVPCRNLYSQIFS